MLWRQLCDCRKSFNATMLPKAKMLKLYFIIQQVHSAHFQSKAFIVSAGSKKAVGGEP
jgi:hypothetical protein